jgi:hypothetical protein
VDAPGGSPSTGSAGAERAVTELLGVLAGHPDP